MKPHLYFAWFVALAATLGSLFFSEVLHLPPCILCWYQRIAMYPLVAILAVAIIRKDKNVPFYVLPLSIIGLGFAFFHWLLQLGIIPDRLAPCTLGISCTTKYVEYWHFITIPLLSLFAFAAITIAMLLSLKTKNY